MFHNDVNELEGWYGQWKLSKSLLYPLQINNMQHLNKISPIIMHMNYVIF